MKKASQAPDIDTPEVCTASPAQKFTGLRTPELRTTSSWANDLGQAREGAETPTDPYKDDSGSDTATEARASSSSSNRSRRRIQRRSRSRMATVKGRPTKDKIEGQANQAKDEGVSDLKVIVFVYDIGMISPIHPRKEWFCLLGTKLAGMGYVVVIPYITLYPYGTVEDQVVDLRHVLSFVQREISSHGGDHSSIHLMGHGLSAHLALFTVVQEAIVDSVTSLKEQIGQREGLKVLNHDRGSGEQDASSSSNGCESDDGLEITWTRNKSKPQLKGKGKGKAAHVKRPPIYVEIPNGLRELRVYGAEVPLVKVKGIILLSPVVDVIRQIRHESTLFLEHLSSLRRSHGPTQVACMKHSVGHLLFAFKAIIRPEKVGRVMIVHGAHNTLIPLDSAHWLSELLYGLDIPTTFRPYRTLGHYQLLTCLMKGFEGESGRGTGEAGENQSAKYAQWVERDLRQFVDAD